MIEVVTCGDTRTMQGNDVAIVAGKRSATSGKHRGKFEMLAQGVDRDATWRRSKQEPDCRVRARAGVKHHGDSNHC